MKYQKNKELEKLKKEIGFRVQQAREKLGASQPEFGDPSLIDSGAVSRIENGITTPNLLFLKTLYEYFSINLNWIFTGEGPIRFKKKPPEKSRKHL